MMDLNQRGKYDEINEMAVQNNQKKEMHIQEIILEGFKTYVNRTVINGFDSQFNAITGFNGSGKSNILDAIQFLLGSTNKQMLRLRNNLTELIYKEGCSGIQKASISIKFRCQDKSLRPTGYESTQQLLVTRQISKDKISKFFINGLASNLGKVKTLFRSIHLNIENPHFLVKQGQITKIINLKPSELLGMIQQTAGTAIYNKTKSQSERMIKNKEVKLDSINEILKTSIIPQMDKLKLDRKRYTAYKEKQNQLKKLNEEVKTYEFISKRNVIQKKQFEITHVREQLNTKKTLLQESTERLAELQGKIKILKNKNSSTVMAKFNQASLQLNQKKNEHKQIKKRIEKIETDSFSLREELVNYEQSIKMKKEDLQWKIKELINHEKRKQQCQALLREANQSKGDDNGIKILEKQINQEKEQIKETQLQIKSMTAKLQMLKSEQTTDKTTRQQIDNASGNISKAIEELETQIKKQELIKEPRKVDDPQLTNNYLQRLEEDRRRMQNQYYQLKFMYNDPVPNFDRTKVKGKLFSLFRIKERSHQRAIEIGAGQKLYSIVVENEIVSKMLIDRETFGKTVSIIPNNKIRFKELKPESIREAKKVSTELGGLAKPAYELIEFDDEIRNSIMYAFSAFIVCSSSEIAKRIAYHSSSDVSCKCVTYDGDIFEKGTLTGGHINQNSLVLNIYNDFREIENKINEERKKFQHEKKRYNEYVEKFSQFKRMKKQLQIKINRRDKLKAKLTDLAFNHKKRNFRQEIQAIENRLNSLKEDIDFHRKKEHQIQAKLKQGGKSIQQQRKELEKEKKSEDAKVDEIKKTSSIFEVQIETLTNKIEKAKEMDAKNQQEILKLQNNLRNITKQLQNLQHSYENLQEEKKKIEREQALAQSKLEFLTSEETILKNQQKKSESDVVALQRQLQSSETFVENNSKQIKKILQECHWLENNRQYEINSNFNYDGALRQYKNLTIDVDKLKKTAKITIDDHSYQKLVDQYNSLLEKRQILQNDKITLLNNMHDLDDKRTQTLQSCYKIVKQNLGKIFNDLLPGATAHLNLIDETDVTKGAELQVQFNKVKKQLSELSGGQRSLLALSFILALLLYKPSPFYILDEIDSALDLSHTQNIGYMISQRFPQSQFIIISLKEGMFQNANVLFKVHFAEGESKVERQILKKK